MTLSATVSAHSGNAVDQNFLLNKRECAPSLQMIGLNNALLFGVVELVSINGVVGK